MCKYLNFINSKCALAFVGLYEMFICLPSLATSKVMKSKCDLLTMACKSFEFQDQDDCYFQRGESPSNEVIKLIITCIHSTDSIATVTIHYQKLAFLLIIFEFCYAQTSPDMTVDFCQLFTLGIKAQHKPPVCKLELTWWDNQDIVEFPQSPTFALCATSFLAVNQSVRSLVAFCVALTGSLPFTRARMLQHCKGDTLGARRV